MGATRRQVGFWHAVGQLRVRDVFTVEALAAIVLGVGLAIALALFADLDARLAVASQYVSVVAALVGIVFAGLALVAALMSESYLRLLRSGESGVLAFFRPFMIAVGLQVATIIASLLYTALGRLVPAPIEPWVFGLSSVLFFGSALEVVVLSRSVLMHAELRSRLGEVTDLEVERSRKRSGG